MYIPENMLLIIASLVVLLIVLFISLVDWRVVRVRVIGTFITESFLHFDVVLGSGASEDPSPEYRAEKRHLAASLALVATPARLLKPIWHPIYVVVRHLRGRLVRYGKTRVSRGMRRAWSQQSTQGLHTRTLLDLLLSVVISECVGWRNLIVALSCRHFLIFQNFKFKVKKIDLLKTNL